MDNLLSFGKRENITINGTKALTRISAFVEYILTFKEFMCNNSIMREFFEGVEKLEVFLMGELDDSSYDILKSDSGALFRYKWFAAKSKDCVFPLKKKTKACKLSKSLDFMFLKSIDDDRILLMRSLSKLKESAVSPINTYLSTLIANIHSRLPCIKFVKPYLNEKKMHNRDIALIRLAITVSILRNEVCNPMFAEFGLKLEPLKFANTLTLIQTIIGKQKIDRFDHAAAFNTIYENVTSEPWFTIFEKDSSSMDTVNIIYYLNSIVVLEKEVRRDLGLASLVKELKTDVENAVSSRFSSELEKGYKEHQTQWIANQMKAIVAVKGEMESSLIISICDKCNALLKHMNMDPISTSNSFKHAQSLYNSVMKHYVIKQ